MSSKLGRRERAGGAFITAVEGLMTQMFSELGGVVKLDNVLQSDRGEIRLSERTPKEYGDQ